LGELEGKLGIAQTPDGQIAPESIIQNFVELKRALVILRRENIMLLSYCKALTGEVAALRDDVQDALAESGDVHAENMRDALATRQCQEERLVAGMTASMEVYMQALYAEIEKEKEKGPGIVVAQEGDVPKLPPDQNRN